MEEQVQAFAQGAHERRPDTKIVLVTGTLSPAAASSPGLSADRGTSQPSCGFVFSPEKGLRSR